MSNDTELASLRRRLAATTVDLALMLSVIGLVLKLAHGTSWWTRLEGWFEKRSDRGGSPLTPSPLKRGLTSASDIALRNWRSPGARLARIRRADAATGGPVTVASVVIQRLIGGGFHAVVMEIMRPSQERASAQLESLKPALEEIRRRHADNPPAMAGAIAELYRQNDVTPFRACAPIVAALTGSVILQLPALWSRRHQTLPQYVAGVVVIRA